MVSYLFPRRNTGVFSYYEALIERQISLVSVRREVEGGTGT